MYAKFVGSDSFLEPGWLVEIGGYRETEYERYGHEDSIVKFLDLGVEIRVNGESDIEYPLDTSFKCINLIFLGSNSYIKGHILLRYLRCSPSVGGILDKNYNERNTF